MSPIAVPEIVDTSMDINGTDIVLSGKVSDGDRIKGCGFYFGRSEAEMEKLPSDLPVAKEFTVTLKGMAEPGNMYFCRSFIVAGNDTIMSGLNSVKADYRPPIVTIDSLRVSDLFLRFIIDGSSVYGYDCYCYFNIKDDFSGDLFAVGLCWGTSESPTIDMDVSGKFYIMFPPYSMTSSLSYRFSPPYYDITLYLRAFAISNVGITYSDEASVDIPALP